MRVARRLEDTLQAGLLSVSECFGLHDSDAPSAVVQVVRVWQVVS